MCLNNYLYFLHTTLLPDSNDDTKKIKSLYLFCWGFVLVPVVGLLVELIQFQIICQYLLVKRKKMK